MRIRHALVCAAVALVAAAAPSYADPVDDVVRAAEKATGVDVPEVGRDVVGPGGGVPGAGARSAVVGYVFIEYLASQGQLAPSFTPTGALADPNLWTCSDNAPAVPYTVTCTPQPSTLLTWSCDVLHADITTLSAGSRARTSLDCDGGGAEAQTGIVIGTGHDFQWAVNAPVTAFTCTVDGGSLPAVPDYYAGCGDPGLVRPA